jgi:hypothetical protein
VATILARRRGSVESVVPDSIRVKLMHPPYSDPQAVKASGNTILRAQRERRRWWLDRRVGIWVPYPEARRRGSTVAGRSSGRPAWSTELSGLGKKCALNSAPINTLTVVIYNQTSVATTAPKGPYTTE